MPHDPAVYLTEREQAREKLRESIDALAERANLQVQMQKEPVKLLGGASAVGAVIGLVMGRQLRRSKKIYVDAASPAKHQKGLMKAQSRQQRGGGVGGALVATLGTLAVKTLTEKVITPRLEAAADKLLERSGQTPGRSAAPSSERPSALRSPETVRPVPTSAAPSPTDAFLKKPAPAATVTPAPASASAVAHTVAVAGAHPGVVPVPDSIVEAKAHGSAIRPDEKANPNLR